MDVDAYNKLREEFMQVFEREEKADQVSASSDENALQLSSIMNDGWARGTFWYVRAMQSVTGLWSVFCDRIQPPTVVNTVTTMSFTWWRMHTGQERPINSWTKRSMIRNNMTESYVKLSGYHRSRDKIQFRTELNCPQVHWYT